jgi:peroxiredoxin
MRPHSQEARAKMTIKVGDKLPDATFQTMTADGVKPKTSAELFAGKKVVLFGVPALSHPHAAAAICRASSPRPTNFSPRA